MRLKIMRIRTLCTGLAVLAVALGSVAEEPQDGAVKEIQVTWDYGSEPGKESTRWKGQLAVPVRHEPPECASRFRLTGLRHEYVLLDPSGRKAAPAFVVATFRKGAVGSAKPPTVDVVRWEYTKDGKPTKKTHVDTLAFRLDFPPNRLANWEQADVDVTLSAPNHDLYNPTSWKEVVVHCD